MLKPREVVLSLGRRVGWGFCLLTWLALSLFCFFLYFWRTECRLDEWADHGWRTGLDCLFFLISHNA